MQVKFSVSPLVDRPYRKAYTVVVHGKTTGSGGEKLREYCESRSIPGRFCHVDTLEQAATLSCVFNNWAVFYDGKFVTVNQMHSAMVEKLLKKWRSR